MYRFDQMAPVSKAEAVRDDFPLQEPKLSAARRIVSEWTDYDEEMFRLGEQIGREREEQRQGQDTPSETRDEL